MKFKFIYYVIFLIIMFIFILLTSNCSNEIKCYEILKKQYPLHEIYYGLGSFKFILIDKKENEVLYIQFDEAFNTELQKISLYKFNN